MKPGYKKALLLVLALILFACLLGVACRAHPALGPEPGPAAGPDLKPKVILGIFGGMGPEATANMYQLIVKMTPAKRDQEHIPTLIFSFPQVPDRTTAILADDPAIVPWLVEGVTRLERAGAAFIIIPCNTAHYYHAQMQAAVRIPILHMIREAAVAVAGRYPQCRQVGLLATSGTIRTGLYEKEFAALGLRTIVPDEAVEEEYVMKAIGLIKAGKTGKESEDLLAFAAAHLESRGAEVLVLGCTEIPLAFNPERARVPVVNATRVLAEAAIRRFLELSAQAGEAAAIGRVPARSQNSYCFFKKKRLYL